MIPTFSDLVQPLIHREMDAVRLYGVAFCHISPVVEGRLKTA